MEKICYATLADFLVQAARRASSRKENIRQLRTWLGLHIKTNNFLHVLDFLLRSNKSTKKEGVSML